MSINSGWICWAESRSLWYLRVSSAVSRLYIMRTCTSSTSPSTTPTTRPTSLNVTTGLPKGLTFTPPRSTTWLLFCDGSMLYSCRCCCCIYRRWCSCFTVEVVDTAVFTVVVFDAAVLSLAVFPTVKLQLRLSKCHNDRKFSRKKIFSIIELSAAHFCLDLIGSKVMLAQWDPSNRFSSKKMKDISPFMGLLVPLLWTFSDVYPAFKATTGIPSLRTVLCHLHTMYFLDSGATTFWPIRGHGMAGDPLPTYFFGHSQELKQCTMCWLVL